ncbi:MAG: hypothetical protein A2076_13190 [Geobacteraceae bacterium GWC2_53_11]|nr:MAG: hypothetical protein A2076_13190 [Geobacteraceae bacterium GWC2_53_11]
MHLKVTDEEAPWYRVIDQDTGNEITCVVEANDETGFYKQLKRDADGKYVLDENDEHVTESKQGNIKLIRV